MEREILSIVSNIKEEVLEKFYYIEEYIGTIELGEESVSDYMINILKELNKIEERIYIRYEINNYEKVEINEEDLPF